jgi:DNA-binding MarR family transcriptional regulator
MVSTNRRSDDGTQCLKYSFAPIRIADLYSGFTRAGLEKQINEQILIALRRIARAIDLHSRSLAQTFGLTGPQVVLLRELLRNGRMHVAELAQSISLSHATVTDILNRLEKRGLIVRTRSIADRRCILVTPTERAVALVQQSPPLLQERFSQELERLQEWELTQILSVLQRVALMMDAKQLDASPLLSTGSVTADPEMIEIVTRSDSEQAPATKISESKQSGALNDDRAKTE